MTVSWGGSRWYVVFTKPSREIVARNHLVNQEFTVFLPLRHKTIRRQRRISTGLAPLFPGYLFISLDPDAIRWRAINGTIGVKYLISRDDRPIPLPLGFVEALQLKTDINGVFTFGSGVKVGDRVELMHGPFAQQVGRLSQLDDRGRVAVLLQIMSGIVTVKTKLDNLMLV